MCINQFFISAGGAYNPDRCEGLEVVNPKLFFPYAWLEAADICVARKTVGEWEQFLENSISVDTFSSSMKNSQKILKPQYYGLKKPMYSYIAPKYCPTSYFSAKVF